MHNRSTLYVLGIFLIGLAGLMMIPAIYDLCISDNTLRVFLRVALTTGLTGFILALACKPTQFSMKPRQAFLLTTLSWLVVCSVGALPIWLRLSVSYTDAFFETMSGITTTGSTILTNLDHTDRSVLLWRSILQWSGGIGFIVIAVAVLPFLKVGGMRLFQSESSDWSEKSMPRSGAIAQRICLAYVVITLLCTYAYLMGGMSGFDAINHAMTTVSTGGYSTFDASMGHYHSDFIIWSGTVFMVLSSLPFVLFVRSFRREPCALFQDTQVQAFVLFLLVVWLAMGLWLWRNSDYSLMHAITLAAFNTTSTISTTGFAYGDYTLWGNFSNLLFFFLLFVGGCSGSTAGGIKIFRFQIGGKLLYLQMKQLVHPRACFVQSYNHEHITHDILRSLIGFTFFFILSIAVMSMLLALCGLDFITSLTGATTAVANVGPGLGEIIGPAGNFSTLPAAAKWILSMGMLLGRLEVITVLVLFTPVFWKG